MATRITHSRLQIPNAVTVGSIQLTAAKLAFILGSPQRWSMLAL